MKAEIVPSPRPEDGQKPSLLIEGKETEFVECDTCRAKPGWPALCQSCLHNRTLIGRLRAEAKRPSGDVVVSTCSSVRDAAKGAIVLEVVVQGEAVELIRLEVYRCFVLGECMETDPLIYAAARDWCLGLLGPKLPSRTKNLTFTPSPGFGLRLEIDGEEIPRIDAREVGGGLAVSLNGEENDHPREIWSAFLAWLNDACRMHIDPKGERVGS